MPKKTRLGKNRGRAVRAEPSFLGSAACMIHSADHIHVSRAKLIQQSPNAVKRAPDDIRRVAKTFRVHPDDLGKPLKSFRRPPGKVC